MATILPFRGRSVGVSSLLGRKSAKQTMIRKSIVTKYLPGINGRPQTLLALASAVQS
jgi:hypothetical protein